MKFGDKMYYLSRDGQIHEVEINAVVHHPSEPAVIAAITGAYVWPYSSSTIIQLPESSFLVLKAFLYLTREEAEKAQTRQFEAWRIILKRQKVTNSDSTEEKGASDG